MELFLLYLWFKLDNLILLFAWVAGLSTVFCVIMMFPRILWVPSNEKEKAERDRLMKWQNYALYPFCFAWFFFLALPSSKETAVLVIASYASDLAKSPEGVKAWSLIRKTANNMLDEALKEPVKK